jgi:hypothetical protein
MYPPIFATISSSTAVKAVIGSNPVRFFLFGKAPQGVVKPYAVWRQVGGAPENYLGDVPDIDGFTTQIDIYATSSDSAHAVAVALRDAIEPVAHITSWIGDSRDPETLSYVFTFQVDWLTPR